MTDTPTTEPTFEIERKYHLQRVPAILFGRRGQHLRQGYLSADSNDARDAVFGRVRATGQPDGSESYTHTVKSGTGLVREERERSLTREEFEELWPQTTGRRIEKHRHRIAAACVGLVWQVDIFVDRPLVLAEIELTHAEQPVSWPRWLRQVGAREVTDDERFTNAAIAVMRGVPTTI